WRSALSSSITRTSGRSATPIVAADAIIVFHEATRLAHVAAGPRARALRAGLRFPEGPRPRTRRRRSDPLRHDQGRVPAAGRLPELREHLRRARRLLRELDAPARRGLRGRPG